MVSQKRFSQASQSPAKRMKTNSQTARLRALESRVSATKPEIQIRSTYTTADLQIEGDNTLKGVMNQLTAIAAPVQGRNYKTVSVKASLAEDSAYASEVLYRYRMILFSNKNNSSVDNTRADQDNPVPAPYGEAANDLSLNFNIDYKKWNIYDDKTMKRDLFGGDPQTQIGLGGLMVQREFTKPKLCRLPDADAIQQELSHGAIGLVIYRQRMDDGSVERVRAAAVDAPRLNCELKWIDP